jgi:hypothetical protein
MAVLYRARDVVVARSLHVQVAGQESHSAGWKSHMLSFGVVCTAQASRCEDGHIIQETHGPCKARCC